MSATELGEWRTYWRLEPFGAPADDMRFGAVAAMTANVHRARDATPIQPEAFTLTYETRAETLERNRAKVVRDGMKIMQTLHARQTKDKH